MTSSLHFDFFFQRFFRNFHFVNVTKFLKSFRFNTTGLISFVFRENKFQFQRFVKINVA